MFYNVALFVHILGAIGYFVALGIIYVSVASLRQAPTVGALRIWAGAALRGTRLLPISGAFILIAGIYMVAAEWGDRAVWAGVAFIVFVLLGIATGVLQIRRIAGFLRQAGDHSPEGPLPAAIAMRARNPVLWVATNAITVTALGIVYLMTVKPDVAGSLIALGVSLVIGLAVGLATQRQRVRVAAAAG